MRRYWDFIERTDCGTSTPTRATSERERCCPKSRTKKNGSLPMSASRWREANRYCKARKELLAVVRALKHFKCYLYGQKITVRTDNSAVSWLHRSKDPVGQPARWIKVIDTYDITFQHRPGRKHGNADALSRYPCRQCWGDCETPVKAVRAVTRSQKCEPGWTPGRWQPGKTPTLTLVPS